MEIKVIKGKRKEVKGFVTSDSRNLALIIDGKLSVITGKHVIQELEVFLDLVNEKDGSWVVQDSDHFENRDDFEINGTLWRFLREGDALEIKL